LAELPVGGDAGLSAMARRVIDTNHYMTLATRDPDGTAGTSAALQRGAQFGRVRSDHRMGADAGTQAAGDIAGAVVGDLPPDPEMREPRLQAS